MTEPLTAGYRRHASPQAIEARVREASRREHEAAQEVNALLALLRERVEQIDRGEWPTSATESGPQAATPKKQAGARVGPGGDSPGERT